MDDPKGEIAPKEDPLSRAQIEFQEELGVAAPSPQFNLGFVKQKGGKTVHAWGSEGDLPEDFELVSNSFELEWPPRSGRQQTFPEVDHASFFPLEEARTKMNPAQTIFLDRLIAALAGGK